MKGETDFTCIDVGTTEIRTVCARVVERVIHVLGVGTSPARGFSKGFVCDIDQAKVALLDSTSHAEALSDCKVTSATVGIPARYLLSSFNSTGVLEASQPYRRFTSADLRRAFVSAVSARTLGDNSEIIHVIPRSYAIDGNVRVANPIGFYGSRLQVETYIITADTTPVRNLKRCVRSIGVSIANLLPNVLASGEAVLTQDEKNVGIILADIGGGITEIAIFKDGGIVHISALPVAGHQFTTDISIGLGLPYDKAEQIVKRYGNPTRTTSKGYVNVQVSGSAVEVSLQDVNAIIRARMEELLRLIVLELPDNDYGLTPAGLVITGGMANLPGIAELALPLLRLPVRIGRTQSVPELPRFDLAPEWTSMAGLLLLTSKCLQIGIRLPSMQAYNVTRSKNLQEARRPALERDKDVRDYEKKDELRKAEGTMKTSYAPSGSRIKVVGLGGSGCNVVTRMVREQIRGVEFIAMDSDAQHLAATEASIRIQLGEHVTRGLGAGGEHLVGQQATEENLEEVKQAVAEADMVFIVAGMGGGTGTGGIPIVAGIAKRSGVLTIAIVTKPFTFEGHQRSQVAEEGLLSLANEADAMLIVPNDRLLQLCDDNTTVVDAFRLADDTLFLGVKAISEVVTVPGLINLDFADIKSIMTDAGPAWMSVGRASGQSRAVDAAEAAMASPLLDVSIGEAKGVLFNITGGPSLTLFECNEAAQIISQAVNPEANIVFGVIFDPKMGSEIRITVIATGFAMARGGGTRRSEELRRLIKGSSDVLGVPSFLRRRSEPVPRLRLAIDYAILEKGYSVFRSRLDGKERSSRLRKLRDQIAGTNPHDPAVELSNSLWRLSQDAMSVPDHASVMVRLLQTQSSEYEANPLYVFYSFISSACGIGSASDFGRIPLELVTAINKLPLEISSVVRIPTQVVSLFQMIESLSGQPSAKAHMNRLRKSERIMRGLATSLKSEVQTPEVICLSYVINQWLELAAGGIRIALSSLRCYLATSKPLYLNRINEVQIAVSGGVPGQPFQIHAPVTQNYDAQLDDTSFVFQGPVTNIDMRIRPHAAGPLTILIEIEGVTHQIEGVALLENPFIVGVPVQSEDMFVGRQEIVNRLIRGIVAPQPTNFLITGRRRIGKTSLLYAIKRQLPKSFLPVLMSTETCGKSPVEVCRALQKGISRAIAETQSNRSKRQQLPPILEDDPTGDFMSWLETTPDRLSSSSLDAIVLLIDEALDLTEWDDRVQRLLRYIFSSMTWIRGVLAGPPDIIERMTEHVSSPLYNVFTTLRLGPIDINDTHKLIIPPLKNCGIAGAEDMLGVIYDYSGGVPYYIQAVGSELIEHYFSRKLGGEELLTESLLSVRGRLKTSYPVTLKNLSAEQKVSIVLVASGVNPPEVPAKRLEQADLVEREGSNWIIRARIEREWVKEYTDQLLDSAGQELWDHHKREINLLELAEDLRKLKKEFATSDEASEALTSAISAAEKENGAKALKHLGKVGQWVLDTATRIGADVAVAAIKRIYGLP